MSKRNLILVLSFCSFLGLISCQSESKTEYNYYFHAPESVLHLNFCPLKKETNNATGDLETLFDNDPKTGIDLSNLEGELSITFSKPVYVKEYRFTFRIPKQPSGKKPYLFFKTSSDPETSFTGDFLTYALTGLETTVSISGDKNYFGLLKNCYLELSVNDSDSHAQGQPYSDGPVFLTDMKVLYTDKPVFIPTMTLEEIEQKYVKGRSRWKFDDWVDDDRSEANHHIEETVMMNLMYFGLGGDETAERMFKAFYPEGTTTSEWSSFLRSWYDQTKAEKKP